MRRFVGRVAPGLQDGRTDAERAYDRTLAALRKGGHDLPDDPVLRYATVSIFAERYKVEDLEACPELLWECEDDAREDFMPNFPPNFVRKLRVQASARAQAPMPAARTRPRTSRARESRRRSVRTRTAGARGDPSEPSPKPLAALTGRGRP